MKTYPYILYAESNGKREAVFNEKEDPNKNKFLTNWLLEHELKVWQSNHIHLEVDEIESDKVKNYITKGGKLKSLFHFLKEGQLLDCLTINESGKAVFVEPEKTREVNEAILYGDFLNCNYQAHNLLSDIWIDIDTDKEYSNKEVYQIFKSRNTPNP